MQYSTGMYSPNGRYHRWGVFCRKTMVWYFPKKYGQKAAESMARRLNREVI